MKTLFWDATDETGQPYTWGDPRLIWGNPSYILEPGDPGYPYDAFPLPPPSTRRRTAMKHQRYYPVRQAEQIVWLENFRNKIGDYAAALGLGQPEVDTLIAKCRWLVYLLGSWLPAARAWNLACTQAVKAAQTGTGGALTLPVFTAPALPSGVTAQGEGALSYLFDKIAEIKENNGCTDSMCSDLGILGSEEGAPDYAVLAPKLTVTLSGNKIEIGWTWQGYSAFLDQCEIQVDRGDGKGWQVLTYDTTPGYTDNQPFPTTLTQWKYRAIYRVDDQQVGQWSPEVSIAVGG